jgi:quinol monooxygenase YgiN
MGKFLQIIPPTMTTGLDLMHYAPVHGYLDKPDDLRECEVMQDTRIWCKSSSTREAVLDRLGKVAKELESDNSHKVYTFEVCKNEDADDEVRIFSRFGDRDTMEAHLASSRMLDFWLASKEDIGRMESRGYVPNNKGWLHR